jgi:ABC-type sugar transport system ATPase subunit
VYEHPTNVFVAGFIGSPAMSFATMDANRNGSSFTLSRGEVSFTVPATNAGAKSLPAEVIVGVRPEHARLWSDGDGLVGPIAGRADYVEMLGRETLIGVSSSAELRYTVFAKSDASVRPGDAVRFGLEPGRLYLFDVGSEDALAVV